MPSPRPRLGEGCRPAPSTPSTSLRPGRADSVERHLEPGLPLVGSGEPVATARHELEGSDAVLVVDDGKPVVVLTRADLLAFLAD